VTLAAQPALAPAAPPAAVAANPAPAPVAGNGSVGSTSVGSVASPLSSSNSDTDHTAGVLNGAPAASGDATLALPPEGVGAPQE